MTDEQGTVCPHCGGKIVIALAPEASAPVPAPEPPAVEAAPPASAEQAPVVLAPVAEVGETDSEQPVDPVTGEPIAPLEKPRELVPTWLAVLVLVLLLGVVALGGWLLRGTIWKSGPTSSSALEISEWEDRVEADPLDMQAQLKLAFAYQQAERYSDALERYDIVLAADPRDTAALYNAGLVYRELGLDEEAEERLWDVLEVDRVHVLAASTLGEMYAEKGHYKSVVTAVRPAAEAHPEAADLQYLMGLAYEKTGRRDWAEARYRAALKYVPDMQLAKDGLKRLGVKQ